MGKWKNGKIGKEKWKKEKMRGGKASKIKVMIRRQIHGLSDWAFCTSIYDRVRENIDVHVFMHRTV